MYTRNFCCMCPSMPHSISINDNIISTLASLHTRLNRLETNLHTNHLQYHPVAPLCPPASPSTSPPPSRPSTTHPPNSSRLKLEDLYRYILERNGTSSRVISLDLPANALPHEQNSCSIKVHTTDESRYENMKITKFLFNKSAHH
jgi:hypothetical protein